MTTRMSREPAWTWELSAYGRSAPGYGYHWARRRSDDGVERHFDSRPCQCPNAAAYAPVTLTQAIAWWALAFAAFDSTYPARDDDRAEVMMACLLAPWQFIRYMLP